MPPTRKPAAAPKVKTSRVKVRALRTGYYNEERKRAGAVFIYDLPEGHELPTWCELASAREAERNTTGQDEINRLSEEERNARAANSALDQDVI